MLRNHQNSIGGKLPVTIAAIPARKVGKSVHYEKDPDHSLTHKVFLNVADRSYYRELEINGSTYGIYYIPGANLGDVEVRGLLYHDTYHLQFIHEIVSVWQANFVRELAKARSKPSSEQTAISDNQVREMVVENVTGYRKIFDLQRRYWEWVKEVQSRRKAA